MIALPTAFNAARYFVDRNVHDGRGGKTAVECGDEKVNYRQLLERTNQTGNVLRQLGVRPGERVVLILPDGPEFLYCFFGAIKIGAVAVPVNPQLTPAEYEYVLNDSQARVAVVSDAVVSQLRAIPQGQLESLREVVVAGDRPQHDLSFHELVASASADLEAELTGKDDAAFWLYSSGSTGRPKGCIHRHRDMVVCSELYAKGILRMTESDRCYSVARLFFAYGLGNAGYFPLSCGATSIVSAARPTPAGIYADIERYRPTLFFSVPTNYAALLAHRSGQGSEFDLSSVRHAISAGESLPAPLFERFKQRFGVEILDAWGSTETLQMALANRPGEARPGSSGKVIPGYEAKLVDERGNEVPRGEIGALLIKGESTCAGYWNQQEKSSQTFQGDWFRTGDKYQQDEDGYFWYAGRADDMFKVNGRWLSPVEVESALMAHPAVREAAVIARDDEHGLTKPAACVVVNAGVNADDALASDLQDWVAVRIGAYKRPRWVSFFSELPKTSTGKVQRFKLRELQAERAQGHAPADGPGSLRDRP